MEKKNKYLYFKTVPPDEDKRIEKFPLRGGLAASNLKIMVP
jgi:hypothetical protein